MDCLICGEPTKRPVIATLLHFRLIDFGQWQFVRGTYSAFGLRSVLTLVSPICNTLIHWKHRKSRLVLPGGLPRE
jgi:hypothetical protein